MPDDETPSREDQPPTPPPGPTDHGGHGGMATREKAPELAEETDGQDR